jgi:hypothetical protein
MLALRCKSDLPALCAIILLCPWHASFADTSADREAARQLVDSTSLANILHTDAEQAGLIADQLGVCAADRFESCGGGNYEAAGE